VLLIKFKERNIKLFNEDDLIKNKSMRKIIFKILYFISPLILILALWLTNPTYYSNPLMLMTMIIGSIAYTWISFQFILSARPKLIELVFGMDKIYRFHGIMAVVAIAAALVHAIVNEQLIGESTLTIIGSLALALFALVSILTMLSMSPSFILKYRPFKWLKKTIEAWKKFTYEQLRFIHNFTVVAYVALNIHVLMTPNARNYTLIAALYIFYLVVSLAFYFYHKLVKPIYLQKNKYLVTDVIKENKTIWTIKMRPTKKILKKHNPGQFAFFSFKNEKQQYVEHPFSISSSPDDDLSITVRELGDFTKKIGQLKVDDPVLIEGPFGVFSYINHPQEQETVFIVGGIGITPIISMLKHMSIHNPNRKVLLIWGMNTMADQIAKEMIKDISGKMKNLTIIPVISMDRAYDGEKGFIDQRMIQKLTEKVQIDQSLVGYYICGPTIMMDNCIGALLKMGITRKRIHFEKFAL
jgi:predicted ferric reductase